MMYPLLNHHTSGSPSSRRILPLHWLTLGLFALLSAVVQVDAAEEVTFCFSSDTHIGVAHPKDKVPFTTADTEARNQAVLADIATLQGKSLPALKNLPADLPPLPLPRGLILAGDLTDHCQDQEWLDFTRIFPVADGALPFPVFEGFGNHDWNPNGPVRAGVRARNVQRQARLLVDRVSADGLHYSWTWGGIHFVHLNLYPGDEPDPTGKFSHANNDPDHSLSFLRQDLDTAIGTSGRPVVCIHHFGFDAGMSLSWRWWTERERRAYYELLKPYNVIAILHGHSHAAANYRWPDPSVNAKEVAALFPDVPPAELKSFDIYSGGSLQKDDGPGEYFVFRIIGNSFIAAHRWNRKRDAQGWSSDPRLSSVKTISLGTPP